MFQLIATFFKNLNNIYGVLIELCTVANELKPFISGGIENLQQDIKALSSRVDGVAGNLNQTIEAHSVVQQQQASNDILGAICRNTETVLGTIEASVKSIKLPDYVPLQTVISEPKHFGGKLGAGAAIFVLEINKDRTRLQICNDHGSAVMYLRIDGDEAEAGQPSIPIYPKEKWVSPEGAYMGERVSLLSDTANAEFSGIEWVKKEPSP